MKLGNILTYARLYSFGVFLHEDYKLSNGKGNILTSLYIGWYIGTKMKVNFI